MLKYTKVKKINMNNNFLKYGSAVVVGVLLVFMYFVTDGNILQGNLGALEEIQSETQQVQVDQIETLKNEIVSIRADIADLSEELNIVKNKMDLTYPTFTEKIELLESRVNKLEFN